MRFILILFGMCLSLTLNAAAYKCTDVLGKTTYQAQPCQEQTDAVEINLKTGTLLSNEAELRKKELDLQKEKQQKDLSLRKKQLIKNAEEESEKNQRLIKNNPAQFSAYAIPPYTLADTPEITKKYFWRLPDIERYRRQAAAKVLAEGRCQRVEASNININSSRHMLVFIVDCRSGKRIYLSEQDINAQ